MDMNKKIRCGVPRGRRLGWDFPQDAGIPCSIVFFSLNGYNFLSDKNPDFFF